jgi:hypothetical protein
MRENLKESEQIVQDVSKVVEAPGELTARLFGREDFDVIVSERAHFLYLFPIRAVR